MSIKKVNEGVQQFHVQLPTATVKKIRVLALIQEKGMNDLVDEIFAEYIKAHPIKF